jgi:hypothetical protein
MGIKEQKFLSRYFDSYSENSTALKEQQQLRAELPNSSFATTAHPKQLESSLQKSFPPQRRISEWSRE